MLQQMTHDVNNQKKSSRSLNLSSIWWINGGIICVIVVFGSLITNINSQTVVDCSEEALEKCMAPLSFAPGLSMVATSSSAATACQEKIDGVACVETFSNNCLQNNVKTQAVILFFLKGRLDFIKDACNGNLKNEYIKYQTCATKTSNKIGECASKYGEELGLKKVKSASHDDFTKEEMCSSAIKTMRCVENIANAECSNDAAKFEHNSMMKYVIKSLSCEEFLSKYSTANTLKNSWIIVPAAMLATLFMRTTL